MDYEHQTLLAAQNGQPAPAAGWFGQLEWTQRAILMIEGGEYKYIFPVFAYDKKTGKVLRLLHAALTNKPTFDGTLDRLNMGGLRGELRLLRGCP